jgi:hypothetical protein
MYLLAFVLGINIIAARPAAQAQTSRLRVYCAIAYSCRQNTLLKTIRVEFESHCYVLCVLGFTGG